MLLHDAKNIAIQQWSNSILSCNLSNIRELSDGNLFLQMINEYGYQSIDLPSEQTIHPLDIKNNIDVNKEHENTKVKSNDDSSETPMDRSEDVKEYDDLKKDIEDANKESDGANRDSEDANKVSEVVNIESDIIQKEPEDAIKETDNLRSQSSDVNNKSADVDMSVEPPKSDPDDFKMEVAQRYKYLKKFIDDIYHIESDTLIEYEACMESSEFELAKVSVFMLSAVVKKFLTSGNEKLNTLTLLDNKVQEDIQECLTLFYQDFNNISKNDIHKLLSKHAKYKISPRKRNSMTTPQRNCSSKYRKNVMPLSPSSDDMYSNSPLKSFLESPQFKNPMLLSKDKELLKTRKFLHAEEIRSEDLQLEMNSLKKELERKDKEIKNLRKDLRNLDYVRETEDCKNCSLLKSQLKDAIQQNNDLKLKEKADEKQIDEYVKENSRLLGKIKTTEHSTKSEQVLRLVIQQKDDKISEQTQKIDNLKETIKELKNNISQTQLLYEEKLAEIKVVQKEPESPVGECIGSVIEENNEILQTKLYKAKMTIEKPPKQTGMNLVMDSIIKQDLNYHFTEEPLVLPMPDVVNMVCNPEAKKDNKLNNHPKNSQSSSSNLFGEPDISSSFAIATPGEVGCRRSLRKQSKEKQEEKVPGKSPVGSLWDQYNDSNSECENGDKSINLDSPIKQLGLKKTEYSEKRDLIKQLFKLLNELCVRNGANGRVGLSTLRDLKSEKVYILCLYQHIREFLLKFQNNSISKDYSVSDKTLCNYNSTTKSLNQVQKETGELKVKLSELDASISIESKQKAQINELLKNLEVVKQQYKEISEAKEKIESEREEFCTKVKELQHELNKIDGEYKNLKTLYYNLLTEKDKIIQNEIEKYDRKLKICQKKIMNFDTEKEELKAVTEMEKRSKKQVETQNKKLKLKIDYLTKKIASQKMNFEKILDKVNSEAKELANMKAENAKLNSYLQKLRTISKGSYIEKKAPDKVVSCTFNPTQSNARPQREIDSGILVQNSYKIELKVKEQHRAAEPELILPSTSYDIKEVKEHRVPEAKFLLPSTSRVMKEVKEQHRTPETEFILSSTSHVNVHEVKLQDVGNESTLSGALFNKSLHSGLLLCTDDEEGFLNYSSIAEINKDYEGEKTERLQELKRRNTMCLPHMQSSYPIELQSTSPFNKHLLERIKTKGNKVKEPDKREDSRVPNQIHRVPLKKRKVCEVDTSEVGPSTLPITPDKKISKTFKTPTSLQKLLSYRRNHRGIVKPKKP